MPTTNADTIDAELLAFLKSEARSALGGLVGARR